MPSERKLEVTTERKVDAFAIIIIIVSLIGIILIAATTFAGFYLPTYGNRYSCLDCSYYTNVDYAAQIIMIILFIIQIILAINELVPKRFLKFEKLDFIGLILSGLVILFAIIGLGSFGVTWGFVGGYEWWPEAGFYGSFVAGIINAIFYFLRFRNII